MVKFFQLVSYLAPTIKHNSARKLRNYLVLSMMDGNIPTLEVSMAYADLLFFSSRLMMIYFDPVIRKKEANTYIVDKN